MFPDITKLIVKIKIPNGQATGMLISLPDNKEEDLVITVFHLFCGFSGDMNNIGLEAWSGRTDLFTITRMLYERSSRDRYDIAFIFVKKLTWLQPDDNMVIPNGDGNLLYSEVHFAGFPTAIEALDLPFLPLEGKIQGYNDEKKSKWMVKLSEPSEPDTYLYEAIVGMSGCPMYTHRNGRFYFLGMQKNVPSQEKSYYITNVLTYDWCIRAAFELYGIKLPWQNEDLDASYIENRRLFREYQGKAKQQAGTYYLDSLNDQLFPKMVNDKGETFGAEGEASLLTYLRNSWVGSVSLCKSLLITGEGGTGKTVSLLSTCDYVLEQNIFAAYIPMVSLETGRNAPIKNYLVEYIWQGDQEQADLFFRIGQQHSRDGKPSLLLFLDGMNELPEDGKKMVVQEIDQWTKKTGVQLIISSRTNFKDHYGWLSQLEHLRLDTLDQRQISNYLISLGLEIPSENKTLMNLLEIPMLLTLYANTEAQYNQFQSTVGLLWYHDRVNTGALIWNYFQCQFGKVMSNKFDGPEILAYLYALEFVTPFIGFRIEAESLYLIDEDRFYALINEANTYYQALWCGGIPSRISSLARQFSCMSKPWEDPQRQYRILIQELHLFHLRADNKVSFMHQQFRDFFSAVYYIGLLRNDLEFTQFARRPIDYYVLNFLTDLLEEATVQRAWGFMGRKSRIPTDYTIFNTLQIYRSLRRKHEIIDLSDLSFDHMDLRYISLNGVTLSTNKQKASFRYSKISQRTFFDDRHQNSIYSIAYSPDGRRVLTGSADRSVREWDLTTGECIRVLLGHSWYVNSVAYSPDGKRVLAGSYKGLMIEWDLKTGEILHSIQGHDSAVYGVKYSADGKKAISGSFDNLLKEWDALTFTCIKSIRCTSKGIRGIDYSPDQMKVATASYDGLVKVWDIRTGACLLSFSGHNGAVRCVRFTSIGDNLLSGSDDGTVRVWDVETGRCLRVLRGHEEKVSDVGCSPNGKKAISGSYDGTVRVWDLTTGNCLRVFSEMSSSKTVYTLGYSPDGKRIISGNSDLSLQEWDVDTGGEIQTIKGYYKDKFIISYSYLCRNEGISCYINNSDVSLSIWNLESKTRNFVMKRLPGITAGSKIECLAYSQMQGRMFLNRYDNFKIGHFIEEWCIKTGGLVQRINVDKQLDSVGFYDEDRSRLIVMCKNELEFQEWDILTGQLIQTISNETRLRAIKYSENNLYCIENESLVVINLLAGQKRTIYHTSSKINTSVFYEDEEFVLLSLHDGALVEVSLENGSHGIRKAITDEELLGIAVTQCLSRMLSYSSSGRIREWDLETGNFEEFVIEEIPLPRWDGYSHRFNVKIQYLPGDEEFVFCSNDGSMQIWSIERRECIWRSPSTSGIDIVECDFSHAEFDTEQLKGMVRTYGGIVRS